MGEGTTPDRTLPARQRGTNTWIGVTSAGPIVPSLNGKGTLPGEGTIFTYGNGTLTTVYTYRNGSNSTQIKFGQTPYGSPAVTASGTVIGTTVNGGKSCTESAHGCGVVFSYVPGD